MARGFTYHVPLEEVEAYLAELGYQLDPVFNDQTLQYFRVRSMNIGIASEVTAKHPTTGDIVTVLRPTIFFPATLLSDDGSEPRARAADADSLKLYLRLYRRFRKRKR